MGELVGLPTKEIIKKTIAKLAEGQKFNSIEIPGGESVAEYVGRQESFFKVATPYISNFALHT